MKQINRNKNIVLGISAVLSCVALIDGVPYGFFSFLRLIVFVSCAFVAYCAYKQKNEQWMWIFGAIAILFSPIFPVYLPRVVWMGIDVIVAAIMTYAIFRVPFINDVQKDIQE